MHVIGNLWQAWRLIKGSKISFWTVSLAWIAMAAIVVLIGWRISLLLPPKFMAHPLTLVSSSWIIIMLTAPLFAGMSMVAIKRVRGETVSAKTGFQYFRQWPSLALGFLIISIICALVIFLFNTLLDQVILPMLSPALLQNWLPGMLLTFLGTIIFNVTYALLIFIIPLIADRQLPAFSALLHSVRIALRHWLKLFVLLIIFYLLNLITLSLCEIPFVGLICYIVINIWLIPFIFLSMGIAYHQLIDRDNRYAQSLLSTN